MFVLMMGNLMPDNPSDEKQKVFTSGESASAFAAILLFIIPVFGFIIGFVINFIGSQLEYALYNSKLFIKVRRPSQLLLNGLYRRSPIADVDELRKKLKCQNGDIDNERAAVCLHEVKQKIEDTDKIDMLHTKSIFSRNLLTAHFILLIILIFYVISCLFLKWINEGTGYNINQNICYLIVSMIIILIVYWFAWRRNCIIYVRLCFLKYLDTFSNSEQ